jgi:enamine deaminase RidA (YjgF/YER057c/UK114 family)
LDANGEFAIRSFCGRDGGEHYITVNNAPPRLAFGAQLEHIEKTYAEALETLGLPAETAIHRRIFLSDVLNQKPQLRGSRLVEGDRSPVAISVVQQPPLPHAKIALQAYHVAAPGGIAKTRLSPHDLLVEKQGRRHLWTTGLCAGADRSPASAGHQTEAIFDGLAETVASQGGRLADHCVRTWIYLKDVDVFYHDMVESRSRLFARHGMTRDTHYIASTGIEGACGHQFDLVAMDAYSVLDVEPRQVSYLNDFERLCATKDYDVTFERGTRIAYADRAHHFISGTASIDRCGRIVHPGDVGRQLDHALDNVDALLRSGSAGLGDMMSLIVYLRDPTDFAAVDAALHERCPALPRVIVQGAVCRPGWLVEVEGIAIAAGDAPALPPF